MVLFNLVKAMVLVLHRNPKCKVEKFKYKTLEGMHPEIKNKSELPAGNKPSWISPDEVLQSRLINTVYHNKGGGGLKREGGGAYQLSSPEKWGGSLLERGGGEVNRGFTVCLLFVLALAHSRYSPQNTTSWFFHSISNFKRVDKEPILCFAKSLLWGSNVYCN